MRDLLRLPIRASAFLGKEVFEVLRQPRLAVTLILGPFLILLLVGLGYKNEPRALRTLFVAQSATAAEMLEAYGRELGPNIVFTGVINDVDEGKARVRSGEADLLVVAPPDVEHVLEHGQQAEFEIYHDEIDPLQASYIDFIAQFYVAEVNRRVLRSLVAAGQGETADLETQLAEARSVADLLGDALERGDEAEARLQHERLAGTLTRLDTAVLAGLALAQGATTSMGDTAKPGPRSVLDELIATRQEAAELPEPDASCASCASQAQKVRKIDAELADLQSQLADFRGRSPDVMISPFRSASHTVLALQPRMIDFFAPAVLALLLQHVSVTFAALSIVRERRLGTVELFRVSPLSAFEALAGKYASNFLFGAVLAAALTALLIYGLGVPMLGHWGDYAITLSALLFTSLGIGFGISLLAQTESQAVQYAMLVLLASIFLGGLFVSPYLLTDPVRSVSWALPVTYGMNLLQAVMLRGQALDLVWLSGLLGIGVVALIVAWVMLRRLLNPR